MTLEVGSLLHNRYRIEQLLGSGGMGAVCRAYDTYLHQVVAIKANAFTVPGNPPAVNEARRRQFEREASMLARLHHPNIPGVVDHFVTPDGNQYLVMDYVEGEDMAQIIAQKGSLSEAEAVAWLGQVCKALEYLHRHNPPIIHRDIKPQNIKVTAKGQVFLVDFGIAKVGDTDIRTTQGALSVTPGFSPPEQYALLGTDVRSDIYSLGATLYAVLTGQVPPDSISLQTGEVQLVPLRQINARISPAVQQAVLKAMEPKRSDRPQTVTEFWQMLVASGGELETKTIALADQETVPKASARGRRGDLAAEVGLRRLAGPIVRIMNNLRLILLGTGIIIVLATALALSLSRPPTRRASSDAISPGATPPASPTETATELVITPSPVAVATRAEGFVSQTEVVPLIPGLLAAATGTADARLMATQHAIDLTTTRQAAKFLDCDKLEYQVLQPLIDVQTVASSVANVELTWRVSNKATASGCKWGEKGQETRVLNAALAGGSRNTATPVKLTWIQDDEYNLSLDIQLSPGSYLLSWRLLLPKTMLPDGPALEARVVVIALTPNPTPTPTRTPCPSIGYACHCRVECVGRNCYPVCDECSKVICK